MGPGSDGPMGGLGGMESHHMNGSLGKDITNKFKTKPSFYIVGITVCKVLLCTETHFEMLHLLPHPDSLIYSVLFMMTIEELKIRNVRFVLT